MTILSSTTWKKAASSKSFGAVSYRGQAVDLSFPSLIHHCAMPLLPGSFSSRDENARRLSGMSK